MSETEPQEPQSPDEVDEVLSELYGELLDTNQALIQRSRQQAQQMGELQDFFLEQAERCGQIAALHIKGAQLVGDSIGDILTNEWGVTRTDDEDEDDGEDEEHV